MRFSLSLAAIAVVIFTIGCSKSADDSSSTSATPTTTGGAKAPDAGATTTGTTAAAPAGKYVAVQAIFTNSCLPCHASGRPKGGVDMTSYDGVMKGGKDGVIVVAGSSAGSSLIGYLNGSRQPAMPKGRPALTADQIKTISDWIDAGAKNE